MIGQLLLIFICINVYTSIGIVTTYYLTNSGKWRMSDVERFVASIAWPVLTVAAVVMLWFQLILYISENTIPGIIRWIGGKIFKGQLKE